MSKPYENTSVNIAQSQEQIRGLLKARGTNAVRFTSLPSGALLEFVYTDTKSGKNVPFRLKITPHPKQSKREIRHGKSPTVAQIDRAEREVWRLVFWWMKSKFEAIDAGLVEFMEDFLAYAVLSDGRQSQTVGALFQAKVRNEMMAGSDPFSGLTLPPSSSERELGPGEVNA